MTSTALRCAKTVIAQVNKNIPRSMGDGLVHLSALDIVFDCDAELPELPACELDETTKRIGKNIAELVSYFKHFSFLLSSFFFFRFSLLRKQYRFKMALVCKWALAKFLMLCCEN